MHLNCFRSTVSEKTFDTLIPYQNTPAYAVVLMGNSRGADSLCSIRMKDGGEAEIISTMKLEGSTGGFVHRMDWASSSHDEISDNPRYIVIASTKDSRISVAELSSNGKLTLVKSIDSEHLKRKSSVSEPYSIHSFGGRIYIGSLGERETPNVFSFDGAAQSFAVLRPFKSHRDVIKTKRKIERRQSCGCEFSDDEVIHEREFLQAGPKKYGQRRHIGLLSARTPASIVKDLPRVELHPGDHLSFCISGGFADYDGALGGDFAIYQTGRYILGTEICQPTLMSDVVHPNVIDDMLHKKKLHGMGDRRHRIILWELLQREPSVCATLSLSSHSTISAVRFCNTPFNRNLAYATCCTTGALLRINVFDGIPEALQATVEHDMKQFHTLEKPSYPTDLVISPCDTFLFVALFNGLRIVAFKRDECKRSHHLKMWSSLKMGTAPTTSIKKRASSPYGGRQEGGPGYLNLLWNDNSPHKRLFVSNSYSTNFDQYFHPDHMTGQIWEVLVITNGKSEHSRLVLARIFEIGVDGLPRQILLFDMPITDDDYHHSKESNHVHLRSQLSDAMEAVEETEID